jgi:prepilin-type N-terminal cleavage/methylation domain-containing protein
LALIHPGFRGYGVGGAAAGRRHARRGLSLLEMMIAMSILGIGLIMVAAIFPVALSQHRDSVYQARATELATKAEALLRSRVDSSLLWCDLNRLAAGLDSPWQLLPFRNLYAGGGWDWDALYTDPQNPVRYANLINLFNVDLADWRTGTINADRLIGADLLADRFTPLDDEDAGNEANRLVWYGFYRRRVNGTVHYAVAICRQQRNHRFARQDVELPDFQLAPTAALAGPWTDARRFPVPWRVTVVYDGVVNRLASLSGAEGLAELAPVGSKVMVQGATYGGVWPDIWLEAVPGAAGRILTVSDVFNSVTVEIREDLSGLPGFFDIWVFPPPVISGDTGNVLFGKEPPVIDWKVFL